MRLSLSMEQVQKLSQSYQEKLGRKWDRIVSDPFAFTPHEKRSVVSQEEVEFENRKLGEFASNHLDRYFRATTYNDYLRRIQNKSKIVAVGFGRDYDSGWVSKADYSGLEVWWIDVSTVACQMAKESMDREHLSIMKTGKGMLSPRPVVKQGEIRSVLLDPSSVGLNLAEVEMWYFCRTLTCLSETSARIVLRQIGLSHFSEKFDLLGHNRLEIVSAMKDHNLDRKGNQSKLYKIKDILKQIEFGAGRSVVAEYEELHLYFDQVYSAITIRSK